MKWGSFGGTLVYAAAAGLVSYPLALVLMPFFGWWGVPKVVFALAAAGYAAGLFGAARGALAGAALLGLALGFHTVGANFESTALGMGAALGLVRSGFAFRIRPMRALVLELFVGVAALALLHLFIGGGPGATSLGVWGFFLAQSAYFLVGGTRVTKPASAAPDPFEEAQRQAERLLEGI